jgi:hypothetical protein
VLLLNDHFGYTNELLIRGAPRDCAVRKFPIKEMFQRSLREDKGFPQAHKFISPRVIHEYRKIVSKSSLRSPPPMVMSGFRVG